MMFWAAWLWHVPLILAILSAIWPKCWRYALMCMVSSGALSLLLAAWMLTRYPEYCYAFRDGPPLGLAPWSWCLQMDSLTAPFFIVLTAVFCAVVLYGHFFMAQEADLSRYYGALFLFVWAMILWVGADHVFQLLCGWELMAVSSYLLIGFWHFKASAGTGARFAYLYSRLADLGLWCAIGFWAQQSHNLQISTFLATQLDHPEYFCAALLWAASIKAAQWPFSAWLPRAMVGPTPVSALMHSATLVAAGPLLLLRFAPVLEQAPWARSVAVVLGSMSLLYGAVCALRAMDGKVALAYSTVSQLGYIFMAIGICAYQAGLAHLLSHAFFKSFLFLLVGWVGHLDHQGYSLWRSQSSVPLLSGLSFALCLGFCALVGLPPLSGFYSKEPLIEALHAAWPAAYTLALVGVLCSGLYSGRLLSIWWKKVPSSSSVEIPSMFLLVSLAGLLLPILTWGLTQPALMPHALNAAVFLDWPVLLGVVGMVGGLSYSWALRPPVLSEETIPPPTDLRLLRGLHSIEEHFFQNAAARVERLLEWAHHLLTKLHSGVLGDYLMITLTCLCVLWVF